MAEAPVTGEVATEGIVIDFPKRMTHMPTLTGVEADRLRMLLANADRIMAVLAAGDMILDPHVGCPIARRIAGK